jgi:hypothetical protein
MTMKALKVLLPVALLLALAACAKPPQAEIDAARSSVAAAAKNADIVAYAPQSLATAQSQLAQMESELSAKHYDKVKTLALQAKATADAAATDAVTGKAKAQADAAALVAALKKAIPDAVSKLAAARRVPGIKLDAAGLSAQLTAAKTAVADADSDLAAGNYASALAKATAVQNQLSDGLNQISVAVAAATNKKK